MKRRTGRQNWGNFPKYKGRHTLWNKKSEVMRNSALKSNTTNRHSREQRNGWLK